MKNDGNTFAFRLARRDTAPVRAWQARKGPAVAGCSAGPLGNYRLSQPGLPDVNQFC